MEKENLLRDAAESAIYKHLQIIADLKDIIALENKIFRVVNNENEEEITGLKLMDFIKDNVKLKVNNISDYSEDIKTCYEQMEVFDI